jgi:hypothetical protein
MAEGEPSDSFELFSRWCNEPGQSLSAFADSYQLNRTSVARMAATWRWRPRKAALVYHLHREGITAMEHEARDMGREVARHLSDLVDLAGESIREQLAAGRHLSPRDALAVLAEAAKQVQLGANLPTQIVDVRGADPAKLAAAEAMLESIEQDEADAAARKRVN